MLAMELIDTHCHLTHGRLRGRLAEVVQRAADAGVTRLICAASDLAESRLGLSAARKFAGVYCTAGLHPHDAKSAEADYLRVIEELCEADRNVALGEIGLDYHYDFSPRDVQRRVFAEQLDLAGRLGKPIVIHTREAFGDTLAILRESTANPSKVVFHSFTEPPASARAVLDLGSTISFSGIVTFKNALNIQASARLTPDDRLLVETDSPFLSPEPVRKMKDNEPANVRHVAAFLAQLRGDSMEHLAEVTTANAVRMFGCIAI